MAIDANALFLGINSVYGADALGQLARDTMREGVVESGDLAVSQRGAGANMSVDVAVGTAWITGDTSSVQPAYRVRGGSITNLTITSAHATLPRIDLVVLEVEDSAFAGALKEARATVVAGTPAASPVAPALPDTAIPLATVAVGAAVTSIVDANITDQRPAAHARTTGEPGYWFLSDAPHGAVVADGATVSRLRYARLFSLFGTTFGAGDGSTTFGLPDWRGRTLVAAGAGDGLTTRALLAEFGAEGVTLTAAQSGVPAHQHGPGTLAFEIRNYMNGFPGGANEGLAGDTGYNGDTSGAYTVNGSGTTASNTAQNAASSHENVQPSFAATPIIWT